MQIPYIIVSCEEVCECEAIMVSWNEDDVLIAFEKRFENILGDDWACQVSTENDQVDVFLCRLKCEFSDLC